MKLPKSPVVLMYPEVTDRVGGPENVVRYLSPNLSKHVNLHQYPLLLSHSRWKQWNNYLERVSRTWIKIGTDIDIVHFIISPSFQNGSSLLPIFAQIRHLPTIFNVHGIIGMEQLAGATPRTFQADIFAAKIQNLIDYNHATRIVVNSKFMYKNMLNWHRIDHKKIKIIPNGVDIAKFQEKRDNLDLDGDPCVLYIGRLQYVKGIDTLIKAIAIAKNEMPNIKVHFVGNSKNTAPDIRSLIRKTNTENNIIFHSWASQDMVPSYYKAADFCVFPNTLESFGIVLLEAMASGSPIIASDIPAFGEIISDGTTGLFFHKGDALGLSKEIVLLASDSNLKDKLSKNAKEAVQQYDWKNITYKYLELYRSLI